MLVFLLDVWFCHFYGHLKKDCPLIVKENQEAHGVGIFNLSEPISSPCGILEGLVVNPNKGY